MTSYTLLKTPVGDLTLVANETELTGIYFPNHRPAPKGQAGWTRDNQHPVLQSAAKQITEYFAGKRNEFTVPMAFDGTEFQKRVWREIARIPFGRTTTYGELARKAGNPRAIRAAGTATGRNPLSIVIPCHRVVGKNGTLTGYAGGLDRKRHLLALENAPIET